MAGETKTNRQIGDALLRQLKDPFDPKFVKWRIGATNEKRQNGQVVQAATKGIALAYIDSREVTKRLDHVCGISGWQSRLVPMAEGFICEIDIKIGDVWITKSNAAGLTKVEAVKGGASDAFKRAASTWGVGRYLYYLPNVWVNVVPSGKSYALAETPELPEWAMPNPDIENWEDLAELALEASATGDEQDVAGLVVANLDKVRGAESTEELDKIVDGFSVEEQTALAGVISVKTKELIGEQPKTQTKNS